MKNREPCGKNVPRLEKKVERGHRGEKEGIRGQMQNGKVRRKRMNVREDGWEGEGMTRKLKGKAKDRKAMSAPMRKFRGDGLGKMPGDNIGSSNV